MPYENYIPVLGVILNLKFTPCAYLAPLYPLQDFEALYKYCIIIISSSSSIFA